MSMCLAKTRHRWLWSKNPASWAISAIEALLERKRVHTYGLARYDKQTGQDPKFPLTGGVDVKYGLTSNLVLNLTGETGWAAGALHLWVPDYVRS